MDIKWNKNEDATHILEVYSSYLYQAGGILSQHIGLTEFSMIRKDRDDSATSFGLCTLYEPTSKSIVKRTLQNGKTYLNMTSWKKEKAGCYGVPDVNYGDLYKCTYGVGEGNYGEGADLSAESIREKRIGIGNNAGSYLPVYERKTNPDAVYDDGLLKDLVQKIDSGTYEDIAERIDLDYFAKEEAITYLIGNPDALRYNNNNYLLYFRRTDGKAIVIPYDNDRCFGITKDFDVMNGMTDAGVLSTRIAQNKQTNSLFQKTLLSGEDNEAKMVYLKVLDVLKNSDWAKCETFDRYYDIASATYASESFDKGGVNLPFETYLNAKLKQIGATSGDDTVYDNLYVVGNFNSWGDYPADDLEKYRMERVGDHLYRAEIRIDEPLPEDTLQMQQRTAELRFDRLDAGRFADETDQGSRGKRPARKRVRRRYDPDRNRHRKSFCFGGENGFRRGVGRGKCDFRKNKGVGGILNEYENLFPGNRHLGRSHSSLSDHGIPDDEKNRQCDHSIQFR